MRQFCKKAMLCLLAAAAAVNSRADEGMWLPSLISQRIDDMQAKGYKGIANWFYVQFKEEQDHARIFMNYLNSRDEKVELLPIDAVPSSWESVLEMFRSTLEHEKKVTAMINNLAMIAAEDRDYASISRLNWFIDEQVEEEESARDMIAAFEAVEGNKYGMYMLDKELAARAYAVPAPLAATE